MPDIPRASNSGIVGRRNFLKGIAGGFAATAIPGGFCSSAVSANPASPQSRLPERGEPEDVYWEHVAGQYMFEPGLIMMNNGRAGAMPRPVYDTLVEYFKIQAQNPYECYTHFGEYREKARLSAARFIGADADEVTLLRNTTEGLAIAAYGLDMKPGDEVLMSNLEHPAGIFPWRMRERRSGIKVKEVALNIPPRNKDEILNAFNDAITDRTRIILISHAVYHTGLVPPLKELCQLARSKNVLVLADGAHCVGMLNLDMHDLGVDIYANSGYKWLGAPTGTGIFYIRKDLQQDVLPNIVEVEWEKVPNALKYSAIGRTSDPLYIALGEAIDFQNSIGRERIERRIKTLAGRIRERVSEIPGVRLLTPPDPSLSAGLTVLSVAGAKNTALVDYLKEKHSLVIAPVFPEKNAVRISSHIWVTFEQIDILLKGLQEFLP